MKSNLEKDYFIIINDSGSIIENFDGLLNRYKKILIIDKGNTKYHEIENEEFGLIIEKYILANNFVGIKKIDIEELIFCSKKQKKFEYLVFKMMKFLNNNVIIRKFEESKILAGIMGILGMAILYFFYQLGYSFLFGYYFGGTKTEYISVLTMMTNPVPFNFKSIISVGVLLLIFNCILIIPLLKILYSKSDTNILYWICFWVVGVMCFITLTTIFNGDIKMQTVEGSVYLLLLIIISPLFLFAMAYWIKKLQESFKIIISYIFSTILLIIFMNIKWDISGSITTLAVLLMFLISPMVIFIMEKFSKRYIKATKFIFNLIISIEIALIIVLSFKISTLLIIPIVISYFIFMSIYTYLKWNNKKTKNSKKTQVKISNMDAYIVVVIIMISGVIFVYSSILQLCVSCGRMMTHSVAKESKMTIVYELNYGETKSDYFNNEEFRNKLKIEGIIVAQGDDTYYVCKLPERKLVTIKSKNIVSID